MFFIYDQLVIKNRSNIKHTILIQIQYKRLAILSIINSIVLLLLTSITSIHGILFCSSNFKLDQSSLWVSNFIAWNSILRITFLGTITATGFGYVYVPDFIFSNFWYPFSNYHSQSSQSFPSWKQKIRRGSSFISSLDILLSFLRDLSTTILFFLKQIVWPYFKLIFFVTGVNFVFLSAPRFHDTPKLFYADSPFYFAVMQRRASPLFSGRVCWP